jgi:hypothetical protein
MTRQASGTSEKGPVRDHDWNWLRHRVDIEIAPTGLGMCEFCDLDIVPGDEIAHVNDGHYAHLDCVQWDDEEDGDDDDDVA